jgi:voltage-gated potassium channel Kch
MGSLGRRGRLVLTVRWLRAAVDKSLTLKILAGLGVFVLAMSALFYLVESSPGTAGYANYLEALEDILILALSGFDVAKRPVTPIGYGAAIAVLVSGVIFVSIIMADVAARFVRIALTTDKGRQRVNVRDHTLICNWNEHGPAIVDQLLADEASRDIDIVIVADLEEHPYPESGALFVSGSPTRDDVLTRANVEAASTAIVVGTGADAMTSDSVAILTALAIEARQPDVYTCVLVFDPENKKHLAHAHVDEVVCISELTDNLLAQSALNHGLTSLISQLLNFGEGSEIYKVLMPPETEGHTVLEAARSLLDAHAVLLVGLEVGGPAADDRRVITVTENGTLVTSGDCGFVVAESMPPGAQVRILAARGPARAASSAGA